jgi:hypothetical protein
MLEVQLDVSGAEQLAAFEATLAYDPQSLRLGDIAYGALVPDGSGYLGPSDDGAGRVAIGSYNSIGETSSGSGTLAILSFEILDGGPSRRGVALVHSSTAAFDQFGVPIGARIWLASNSEGEALLPYASSGE